MNRNAQRQLDNDNKREREKLSQIDVELFNEYFPYEFRKKMEQDRYNFLNKIEYTKLPGNVGHFHSSLMTYSGRHEHLPTELTLIDDIYPPNIAVLDFILKNLYEVQNYIHLDHGCSLGILSIYLNKLGIKCYNYDNWSQMIKKSHAEEFLRQYNLQDTIVNGETAIKLNADMFSSIGIWSKIKDWGNNFKYIFSDAHYRTDVDERAKSVMNYANLIEVVMCK